MLAPPDQKARGPAGRLLAAQAQGQRRRLGADGEMSWDLGAAPEAPGGRTAACLNPCTHGRLCRRPCTVPGTPGILPLTLPLLQGSNSPLPGSTPKPEAQKTPQGATAIAGTQTQAWARIRLSASVSCFRDQQPLRLPPRRLPSMRVLEAQPTRAEGSSRFTDGEPGGGRVRDSLPGTRLRAGWTRTSRPPSWRALGWASLSWWRGPRRR